jgi:EAL domain-containing protein (putative c-di-GMP-specific phosphodiesterase class I)
MLEITESVMMDHDSATLDKLAALRAAGVHLALDDFGTGYSSFRYLREFPVDTLKIDQGFVAGVTDRLEDTAIVEAVIAIAKTRNLRVVAEGIETEQQAEQLRAMGCDYGQGFFFARPLPPEHIPALLGNPRWDGQSAPRRRPGQLLSA